MSNAIHIYGIHPVREALLARPDTVREVFFATDFSDSELESLARRESSVQSFQRDHPPRSVQQFDTHQGVVAKIDTDSLTHNFGDFLDDAAPKADQPLILLGELQDPQNVGAIIRSAASFDFGGVLIPQRRQTQITPAVVKVSAGMAFRIPLVSIGNVNTTIDKLKNGGFWAYGLDEKADESLPGQDFDQPTLLVVGNEADGIREKTRDHCDKLVAIPTLADRPLNAATAAAVGMYAVVSA